MKSVAHITFSSRRLTRGSIRLREEHRCPVVMEGEKIVGLITERNYARKIALMARSSKDTPVRDIMISSAMYVRSGERHHLRAEIHDPAVGALHHGGARLIKEVCHGVICGTRGCLGGTHTR